MITTSRAQLIIPLLCIVCCSCNTVTRWFCGDGTDFQKQAILKVDSLYFNYGSVKPIGCEPYYVDFIANSESIDTATIRDIHRHLYNVKTGEGWMKLDVYASGKFLYAHLYSGNFSTLQGGH